MTIKQNESNIINNTIETEISKMQTACNICPRNCNAKRNETIGSGFCGAGSKIVIARAAAHFGEEPCISGTNGSGAIFFSGCTMRCVFCQNHIISRKTVGKALTVQQLADILLKLEDSGVHNINMVTPTHFTPLILKAILISGVKIPIIWNTSGYEKQECIDMTKGIVSVYLPDFKYYSARTAQYCSKAPDYFEKSLKAIKTMYKIAGKPIYDDNGLIKKGLIIRHLVLPGLSSESINILQTIAKELPGVPLSLMSQYIPFPNMLAPLNRKVSKNEYTRVLECMNSLNLKGYTQDIASASSEYIPNFLNDDAYI